MIENFIWDGKRPKIATKILSGQKQQGGLGLANIKERDKALKAQWVLKLRNNSKLKHMANLLVSNPINEDLWRCYLAPQDVKRSFPNVSLFWRDVMTAWFELNFDWIYSIDQLRITSLWYNSYIRIGGTPAFDKELYNKGLKTIGDMLDSSNKIIKLEEFVNRFGKGKYLFYHGTLSGHKR